MNKHVCTFFSSYFQSPWCEHRERGELDLFSVGPLPMHHGGGEVKRFEPLPQSAVEDKKGIGRNKKREHGHWWLINAWRGNCGPDHVLRIGRLTLDGQHHEKGYRVLWQKYKKPKELFMWIVKVLSLSGFFYYRNNPGLIMSLPFMSSRNEDL